MSVFLFTYSLNNITQATCRSVNQVIKAMPFPENRQIRLEKYQHIKIIWMSNVELVDVASGDLVLPYQSKSTRHAGPPATMLNPLRARFFRRNINIYLHFVSFLHIDTTQVVEILTQIRQEATYST